VFEKLPATIRRSKVAISLREMSGTNGKLHGSRFPYILHISESLLLISTERDATLLARHWCLQLAFKHGLVPQSLIDTPMIANVWEQIVFYPSLQGRNTVHMQLLKHRFVGCLQLVHDKQNPVR
jgi:hypothetical protein